jgi:hypothetical protein
LPAFPFPPVPPELPIPPGLPAFPFPPGVPAFPFPPYPCRDIVSTNTGNLYTVDELNVTVPAATMLCFRIVEIPSGITDYP